MFLSKATDMSNNLADAVQDLRHQANPLLNRVSDTAYQLRVKARHASDDAVSYIRHEPVKSMLIAAAVGAALAALASLASRSHDRH
jgi:ElaB/YqjD/DUF883 family membrane-anchored ribosome-binding protein